MVREAWRSQLVGRAGAGLVVAMTSALFRRCPLAPDAASAVLPVGVPAKAQLFDLGALSAAHAVFVGGCVVVGGSFLVGTRNKGTSAFRWTPSTGMQSIKQWLAANGCTIAVGCETSIAYAANVDGSVVTGRLENGCAFIARVVAGSKGIVRGLANVVWLSAAGPQAKGGLWQPVGDGNCRAEIVELFMRGPRSARVRG